MQKEMRYYKREGDSFLIYDDPFAGKSSSVSIIPIEGIRYYQRKFHLVRIWGE